MKPGNKVTISNTMVAPYKSYVYPLFNRLRVGHRRHLFGIDSRETDGLYNYEEQVLNKTLFDDRLFSVRHGAKYRIIKFLHCSDGVGANVLDEVLKVINETR